MCEACEALENNPDEVQLAADKVGHVLTDVAGAFNRSLAVYGITGPEDAPPEINEILGIVATTIEAAKVMAFERVCGRVPENGIKVSVMTEEEAVKRGIAETPLNPSKPTVEPKEEWGK